MKDETELELILIEGQVDDIRRTVMSLSQSEELSEYVNTLYMSVEKLREELYRIRGALS